MCNVCWMRSARERTGFGLFGFPCFWHSFFFQKKKSAAWGSAAVAEIMCLLAFLFFLRGGGEVLELFSSRVSVDQDLSVIVAETINDDDVKQRLVPIVFHASVTQQRSSGSKTRISCSHVHERTNKLPTLANKGSRKREPHKLMLKT